MDAQPDRSTAGNGLWDTMGDRLWDRVLARERRGVPQPKPLPPPDPAAELRHRIDALVAQAEVVALARGVVDVHQIEAREQAKDRAVEAVLEAAESLAVVRVSETEGAERQLAAVRRRAEGWRNGVSVTFGLILASLAIRPGEGFMRYEGDTRDVLRLLVGASVLLSLLALMLLVRAAHGPGWLKELSGAAATKERLEARAKGAYLDFWIGRLAWGIALVLFIAAVTVTWFAQPPG